MLDLLLSVVISITSFLVLIAVLVTVHEWGHYKAARILGIEATHFSIGMGPALWSRTDRNGCVWQIAAFPIGGYVRFLGDKDGSSAVSEAGLDEKARTMDTTERRRYFSLRGPLDRAFVILAGPALNLILGLAIISSFYMIYGRAYSDPVIDQVVAESPAAEAGLMSGDRILSVNGKPIEHFEQLFAEISLHPGATVVLDVLREPATEPMTFTMVAASEKMSSFGVDQTVGRIGVISDGPRYHRTVPPLEALWVGTQDIYNMGSGMLTAIGQIVSGSRSVDDIGGPVKMAQMSGNAVQASWEQYILFMAAISVSLGIMNLLPLPVLDGGQLIVCAIEATVRRPVHGKVLYYIQGAGAVFLVVCMIGITLNDILGLVSKASGTG